MLLSQWMLDGWVSQYRSSTGLVCSTRWKLTTSAVCSTKVPPHWAPYLFWCDLSNCHNAAIWISNAIPAGQCSAQWISPICSKEKLIDLNSHTAGRSNAITRPSPVWTVNFTEPYWQVKLFLSSKCSSGCSVSWFESWWYAYDAVSDLVVIPFPRRSEIQDQ